MSDNSRKVVANPIGYATICHPDRRKDYSQITEVYERIKIYNKEGYEWATNYANIFKSETISGLKGNTYYIGEDGKVVKVKLGKDGIFEDK